MTSATSHIPHPTSHIPPVLPGFGQRITARKRVPADGGSGGAGGFGFGATLRPGEIIVDNFAGAGGASLGIEAALGRAVDLAINHSKIAIQIHAANHPATEHLTCDVWEVDPIQATRGRPVGLAWFSPDCKHFSRAKGGKPVEKRIRGLAWVVVKWAKAVRPRVIMLENVPEFQTWGPLQQDGRPCPERKGQTFRRWWKQLERLGYRVERREQVMSDYGIHTIRKRFFLVARCDAEPIVWPIRSCAPRQKHESLGLQAWPPAADCIDWTIVCPSIFARKKALAQATLRRIARGIWRFVLEAEEPFIVLCNHGDDAGKTWSRARSTAEPMRTITGSRDANGLVVPHLTHFYGLKGNEVRGSSPTEPMPTQTADPRFGVVAGTLIQTGYGEREGQAPRVPGVDKPLGSIVSTQKHAVVTLWLQANNAGNGPRSQKDPLGTVTSGGRHMQAAAVLKHYGGVVGQSPDKPLGTVTGIDHHGVAVAHLTKFRGESTGSDAADPMHTITSGAGAARPAGAAHAMGVVSASIVGVGGRAGQSAPRSPAEPAATATAKADAAIASATLVGVGGPGYSGKPRSLEDPAGTVMVSNHTGLAAANLVRISQTGGNGDYVNDVRDPLTTVVSKNEHLVAAAHLSKFYGTAVGQDLGEPMPAVTAGGGRGGGHIAVSPAFLVKYYGNATAQDCRDPLGAVTSKMRFGETTATLAGEEMDLLGAARVGRFLRRHEESADLYAVQPKSAKELRRKLRRLRESRKPAGRIGEGHLGWLVIGRRAYPVAVAYVRGEPHIVVDIGLPMVRPRELLAAQFGKFAGAYVLIGNQAQQVAAVGNSVCPEYAEQLVRCNFGAAQQEEAVA